MRRTVDGYRHRRGTHCGSASMRNLLGFAGLPLSESACFGLGSGAHFLYIPDFPVTPGVVFHGRSLDMEEALMDALGLPFTETSEPDPEKAWEASKAAVASGTPVLVNCDIFDLPYFKTETHFPGHRLVLAGFDDEAGEAILADTEFDNLQAVPVASFLRARNSPLPPYPMENRMGVVSVGRVPRPLAEAAPIALRKASRRMSDPAEGALAGFAGIDRVVDDLPRWPEMTPSWLFAARFAYQIIERRGTGGGFFRRLYADFLDEASVVVPSIAEAGLPGLCRHSADRWTDFARILKAISEEKDPSAFRTAAEALKGARKAEERFWEAVARLLP